MPEKLEQFLVELSELCDRYELWVDGENMRIIDGGERFVAGLDYDYEEQAYCSKNAL